MAVSNDTPLTAKQEKFVRLIVDGETQRAAYRKVFPTAKGKKDNYIDRLASELATTPKIKARYKELQEEITNEFVWRKADSLERLKEIADTCIKYKTYVYDDKMQNVRVDGAAATGAINAIREINKVLGLNEPQKLDAKIEVEIIGDGDYAN
jgi:hypothetical protein